MPAPCMKLTVDGYVYEWQRRGGVSHIFSEILPRMCEQEPSLQVKLFTNGRRLAQEPPSHPNISHRRIPRVERYLRPRRLWKGIVPKIERLVRKAYIERDGMRSGIRLTLPSRRNGRANE